MIENGKKKHQDEDHKSDIESIKMITDGDSDLKYAVKMGIAYQSLQCKIRDVWFYALNLSKGNREQKCLLTGSYYVDEIGRILHEMSKRIRELEERLGE